jgi:hypothetical protein
MQHESSNAEYENVNNSGESENTALQLEGMITPAALFRKWGACKKTEPGRKPQRIATSLDSSPLLESEPGRKPQWIATSLDSRPILKKSIHI